MQTAVTPLAHLEQSIGKRPVAFFKSVERNIIRKSTARMTDESVRRLWLAVVKQTVEDFISRWEPSNYSGVGVCGVSEYWVLNSSEFLEMCENARLNPVDVRAEMLAGRVLRDAEKGRR